MSQAGGLNRRTAGILLHLTSLPGPYGIGDLGPEACAWVDALARAGQSWWQVLPLGPSGSGNSPYQCFSACAGNPALISPDLLVEEKLVGRSDVEGETFSTDRVEYEKVGAFKQRLIARAWESFKAAPAPELKRAFTQFRKRRGPWLNDFATFMAIRESRGGEQFTRWPKGLLRREPVSLDRAVADLSDAIDRHAFAQFLFFRQLDRLRKYARAKGVGIIGDLPMFVSPDSADVWANPRYFLLDDRLKPKVVAGVPPDYFSKTGQRWGNPLYNWPAMKKDRFSWWVRRVRATLDQCDIIRIDHFRGFDACWQVPASSPTARNGRWARSPGRELLNALEKGIGGLPFIAEDLGLITPGVEKLRDEFTLPGMRVIQFAFGGDDGSNPFLPHNYLRHCVAYTGTHDNDTSAGWFRSLGDAEKRRVDTYAPGAAADAGRALVRLAWESVSNTAIAPVQDLLGLGSDARMNLPGTASGNWRWRMKERLPDDAVDWLGRLTKLCGRA